MISSFLKLYPNNLKGCLGILPIGCLLVFLSFFGERNLLADLINLEDGSREFVLETKQIIIPEYPYAFNPSIIRWQGRLLLSFRVIPDLTRIYESRIGLVFLDENFTPVGPPQLLIMREDIVNSPCRTEDARLFAIKDRLFMIYSDNTNLILTRGGCRVYHAEILFDGKNFGVRNQEGFFSFEGARNDVREKNWVPFVYNNKLFLSYSLDPHLIFYPMLGKGSCKTVAMTEGEFYWPWGILRGGTPGMIEGDEYLGFFHSSIEMSTVHSGGKEVMHYFLGAYTYESGPPFALARISPDPIIGKQFYNGSHYKPYWRPMVIIFPGGFISNDKYIWLIYGRQDHECWVVKFDKKGLLDSLVPVER